MSYIAIVCNFFVVFFCLLTIKIFFHKKSKQLKKNTIDIVANLCNL